MIGKLMLLAVSLMLVGSLALSREMPLSAQDYIRPPECYKAKYTCVLKRVDGEAFWCMKPVRDRYRDANKSFLAPTQMRCAGRYAAIPKNQSQQPEAQ
ncbi:MAG: hypothetical protein RRB13_01695 [bacterium]|nr:hypothetical protein [bacterium]